MNMLIVSYILIIHIYGIMAMDCEYSSREYQVVLRPDLLINSFEAGVMRIFEELDRIEDAKRIPFKLSRSSLKFKNETLVSYTHDLSRNSEDFFIPITFKSRRKKPTEAADIVMKMSNADPAITCTPLTVSENYTNSTKIKFELDIHAENGFLRAQSAHSYTTDLSIDFNQTSSINISDILIDAATKMTYSQEPLIIVPKSTNKFVVQTAEFKINLANEKVGAMIMFYKKLDSIKSEFSFRIKGSTVDRKVLLVAQQLVIELSQITNIALYSLIQPRN
ncbi:hypothetical protein I4U23_010376 [Adineta vaga]|nr:hypothetical protein I4U23_010376 [Adineta vaga]